jgi:SAM-dependent methyltransferase
LNLSTSDITEFASIVAAELVESLRPLADEPNHAAPHFTEAVTDALQRAFAKLATTSCWGPANRLPSSALWSVAGDILSRGFLQNHARTKPRGYAGDFQMLEDVCQNRHWGTGLAWAFDDYFQRQAAPRAVRNRADVVAERLIAFANNTDRAVRVVSFGSGPAYDLRLVGKDRARLSAPLELTLLDLDPHALEFASEQLHEHFPVELVRTHRVNLKRVPRLDSAKAVIDSADFIFCAGFFDYLDHDDAAMMLKTLWQSLAPGGQLLVFNFSDNNPSRAYMEWIGNWYLTYRSLDELTSLGQNAGLPRGCWRVDVEAEGVNLFLEADKPAR